MSPLARTTAGLLAGLLVLTGCGGDPEGLGAELTADLDAEDADEVAAAVDAFGFDLLGEVAEDGDNTVTSPLSVATLLALALAGAEGDTAEAMADALHLEDSRDVRVGALLDELAATEDVTLSVSNAIWGDPAVSFAGDYVDFAEDTFGATVEEADLGAADTATEIDAWVSEHTEGRIEEMAEDLGLPDPAMLIVLLNAVYFQGEWTEPFDPEATSQEPFTLPGGEEADVDTMHRHGEAFDYTERDGYRMLRLPYGEDERFGLEILLPDEQGDLDAMLAELDVAEWQEATGELAEQEVQVLALPSFELEWEAELTGALESLGMGRALAPGAEFGAMAPEATHLDTVVHKTYIRVDEEGTEAAAATGAGMPVSAPLDPLEFRAEHPFAFTVSDSHTDTILFLGIVADPRG